MDGKTLREGGVYTISFAVHDDDVTTRFHHVSFPLSLGIGTLADIEAVEVDQTGLPEAPIPPRPAFGKLQSGHDETDPADRSENRLHRAVAPRKSFLERAERGT